MSPVPSVVHFQCQSCGMLLTVPVEMAGVTGPCPHCAAIITSPRSVPSAFPMAPAAPVPGLTQPPLAQRQPVMDTTSRGSLPPIHGQAPPHPAPQPMGMSSRTLPEWSNPAGHPSLGTALAGAVWPPSAQDSRATSVHPVMDTVLQRQASSGAAVMPPGAIPPYQTRDTRATRRRAASSRDRQRHGALWLALFMSALTAAGTGWFFRDQVRAAWRNYVLTSKQDPAAAPEEPATPKIESPAATPTAFNPVASTPSSPTTTPQPGDSVPPPVPDTPNPPQAVPVPAPPAPSPAVPVTIMPAQPATPDQVPPPGNLVEVPGAPQPGPPVNVPPKSLPPAQLTVDAPPETQPALEVLKKFFDAPTWEQRLAYVQSPESMKPIMQKYHATAPDGPLRITHVQLIRQDKSPETGPPHCVFQVAGGGLQQPLPIMVENTEEGWKVDWLTFTEFKDDLLVKYLESFQPQPARFHVLIRRAHYFDDDVPALEKKTCFQVSPPMPGFSGDVFVVKGTPLARDLDRHLGWDITQAAVVVQLQWRKEDRYQWVELTDLVQYNWRNGDPPPPKAVAVPEDSSGKR